MKKEYAISKIYVLKLATTDGKEVPGLFFARIDANDSNIFKVISSGKNAYATMELANKNGAKYVFTKSASLSECFPSFADGKSSVSMDALLSLERTTNSKSSRVSSKKDYK